MKRTERMVRLMPLPAKQAVKRAFAAIDPLRVRAYRLAAGDRDPLPPARLRGRAGSARIGGWRLGGERQARILENSLAAIGKGVGDFSSVLDFGCGAGRVLWAFYELYSGKTKFYGTDVDREAVAWAQQAMPDAELSVNPYDPPMSFEDEMFDLLYSVSIFTHFDEDRQFRWLRELDRVMAPGGVGLLTVHGPSAFESFRTGRAVSNTAACARAMKLHSDLDAEGFVYEPYVITTTNEEDFPGIDDSFGLAFHSQEYVHRRWSEVFDVEAVVSLPKAWQDTVIVRKRQRARAQAVRSARGSVEAA